MDLEEGFGCNGLHDQLGLTIREGKKNLLNIYILSCQRLNKKNLYLDLVGFKCYHVIFVFNS